MNKYEHKGKFRCARCDQLATEGKWRSLTIGMWRGVMVVCTKCAKTLRKPLKGKYGMKYKPKRKEVKK